MAVSFEKIGLVVNTNDPLTVVRREYRFLTVVLFLILLAGSFSLERASDGQFISPVPEHILAALFVLTAVVLVSCRRTLPRLETGFTVILPFFLWGLVSAFRGPTTEGVMSAAGDLLVMAILCICVSLLIRFDPQQFVHTLFWAFAISGIVFALSGIIFGDEERLAAFGGGPNVFGRITGLGFLAVLFLVYRRLAPAILLLFGPVMLAATVMSGSRGAMLGLAVGLLFVLPVMLRSGSLERGVRFFVVVLAGLTVVSTLFMDRVVEVFEARIISLTFQEGYSSGREQLAQSAIDMWSEKAILGWGLHSYETRFFETTGFTYPHNLVLQVGAELGALGVVAICVPFFLVLIRRPMYSSNPAITFSIGAFLLYLTVAMFSGDYYDSRQLFVFFIVVWSLKALSASRVDPRGV